MSDSRHGLRDSTVVAAVLALSLVAYAYHAFGTGLVADNWHMLHGPWWFRDWFLQIHRWGVLPIWAMAEWGIMAPSVTLLACLALLALGVQRLGPAVGLNDPLSRGVATLVLILSPMTGAHLAYKQNHLTTGLAFLLTVEALLALRVASATNDGPRAPTLRAGALLFAFLALVWAIGIHQVSALVFVVLVLVFVAEHLRDTSPQRLLAFAGGGAALVVVARTASEKVAGWLLAYFELEPLAEDSPYAARLVASYEELDVTTRRLGALLWEFLFQPQHLVPGSVKWAILFCLVVVVVAWTRDASRFLRVVPALAAVGCLVAPFVVAWLRVPENSYRYTALFTVSVVYGLATGLAVAKSAGWVRTLALGATAWVAFQLALTANASGFMMEMNTQLDLRMTQAILERVQQKAGDVAPERIYLLGQHERRRAPWSLPARDGLMNASATQMTIYDHRPGHLASLLRATMPGTEVYTRLRMLEDHPQWRGRLKKASQRDRVADQLRAARQWPHPQSVVWDSRTKHAYVLLSRWAEKDARRLVDESAKKPR